MNNKKKGQLQTTKKIDLVTTHARTYKERKTKERLVTTRKRTKTKIGQWRVSQDPLSYYKKLKKELEKTIRIKEAGVQA